MFPSAPHSLTWLFFRASIREWSGEISVGQSKVSALTTSAKIPDYFYFYLYRLYPISRRNSGKLTVNQYTSINAFHLSISKQCIQVYFWKGQMYTKVDRILAWTPMCTVPTFNNFQLMASLVSSHCPPSHRIWSNPGITSFYPYIFF